MKRLTWFLPLLVALPLMAQTNTRGGPARSSSAPIIPTCIATSGGCPADGFVCALGTTIYRCSVSGGWGTLGGTVESSSGASFVGDVTADSFTVRTKDDGLRYKSFAGNTINVTDTVLPGTVILFAKGASGTELPFWQNATTGLLPFVTATGSDYHGVITWGVKTATSSDFDTGTKVCSAQGLTCVTTFDVQGTPIGCETAHTSYDGWQANCK